MGKFVDAVLIVGFTAKSKDLARYFERKNENKIRIERRLGRWDVDGCDFANRIPSERHAERTIRIRRGHKALIRTLDCEHAA